MTYSYSCTEIKLENNNGFLSAENKPLDTMSCVKYNVLTQIKGARERKT